MSENNSAATLLYVIDNLKYMMFYLTDKFCIMSMGKTNKMQQLLCGYYRAMFGGQVEKVAGEQYPYYLGPVNFRLY